MTPRQKAKAVFVSALLLLGLSGCASGFLIVSLHNAEALVRHTYDVEVAIGDVESSLTSVGRDRVAYIESPTPQSLQNFTAATNEVTARVGKIRQLTRDNPLQRELANRLDAGAQVRVQLALQSLELAREHPSDPVGQMNLTGAIAKSAFETGAITQQMRGNEDNLLRQRGYRSELLFTTIPGILLAAFSLSALLFWLHYGMIHHQLGERENAEGQLRRLSLELMRAQDDERRKLARELHDGLGQNLVAAKMVTDHAGPPSPTQMADLSKSLTESLAQIRTVSGLLHPPLLDDIGFASAASWLIEGFADRVGMAVTADLGPSQERLAPNVELTLYRILQETLSNVYRHAHARKAEVRLIRNSQQVTLIVRDYGRGMSREKLEGLWTSSSTAGVGLTGMMERVKEQGGTLEVRSDGTGTQVMVTIPLATRGESPSQNTAEALGHLPDPMTS